MTNIFIKPGVYCCGLASLLSCTGKNEKKAEHPAPNVLIILADQWRFDSFGYRGNPDVKTPHIDKLAGEGINFTNAVSGVPVSTPARASILTGQRPLTNGVFMNDVQLDPNAITLAEVAKQHNYQTAYIGKWHLDGNGRSSFIPAGARRQGFDYWKVLECTHNYNHSYYYADTPDTLLWEGYDAFAQTDDACRYIHEHANDEKPFFLFLSWGPPHDPYQTAPEKYRQMYSPETIRLRPNVPKEYEENARRDIAGYYAHCTALDEMVGKLRQALTDTGIDQNTIVLFFSDHGDMLGSQGCYKKQKPYDESIRVPMIFYIPGQYGIKAAKLDAMINMEDIMPTVLGLCSAEIPQSVEGIDYSSYMKGADNPADTLTLIACVQPYGEWNRKRGGKEYRGLRSPRYTYVKDRVGGWLFFDNEVDPYQMNNLIDQPEYAQLVIAFDRLLTKKLNERGDEFLPGLEYVEMWRYPSLDDTGTVPYRN